MQIACRIGSDERRENHVGTPDLRAVGREFLQPHSRVLGPGDHHSTVARPRDLGRRDVGGGVGELHARSTPQKRPRGRDLGGGDLDPADAVVPEDEECVTGRIDVQAVVLRRAEATVRDQNPVVREDLFASAIQLLQTNVVAARAVEPADVAASVGRGRHLRLNLSPRRIRDGQVHRRIRRPLSV
jgi:hypothetical protein